MDETDKQDRKCFEPEEIQDEILLSLVDGIGSLLSRRLLDRFSCASEVLSAARDDLVQVDGIGPKLADQIRSVRQKYNIDEVIRICRAEKIDIIYQEDRRYPASLLLIPDPPLLFYQRGEILPEDALAISVVGTRGLTSYGRRMTQRLVADLVAAGFTIISGLARGIDSIAHETALKSGGRTIAVLGGGLLKLFPRENEHLAAEIIKKGAVISEFHPLCDPAPGNFPRRNRIVSALSLGVLVVEAPLKSGSLITARLAMEQNHEVFAVPGPVEHDNSRGCHRLIRDGAVLVEKADDIIDVLGPLMRPVIHPANPASIHVPSELKLNDLEKDLLKYIGNSPRSIDEIILESGLLPHQVLSLITALEFRRIVERTEGNSVRRR